MRNTYHKWTDNELQYVKDNYISLSDDEIAETLSKTLNVEISTPMVRRQRRNLSIKKNRGRRKKILVSKDVQNSVVDINKGKNNNV